MRDPRWRPRRRPNSVWRHTCGSVEALPLTSLERSSSRLPYVEGGVTPHLTSPHRLFDQPPPSLVSRHSTSLPPNPDRSPHPSCLHSCIIYAPLALASPQDGDIHSTYSSQSYSARECPVARPVPRKSRLPFGPTCCSLTRQLTLVRNNHQTTKPPLSKATISKDHLLSSIFLPFTAT